MPVVQGSEAGESHDCRIAVPRQVRYTLHGIMSTCVPACQLSTVRPEDVCPYTSWCYGGWAGVNCYDHPCSHLLWLSSEHLGMMTRICTMQGEFNIRYWHHQAGRFWAE